MEQNRTRYHPQDNDLQTKKDQPKRHRNMESKERFYGLLENVNIKQIQFGQDYTFPPWYGSSAYFSSTAFDAGFYVLGPDYYNNEKKTVLEPESTKKRGRAVTTPTPVTEMVECMYVCEYCFKYTTNKMAFLRHSTLCTYKEAPPGKIKYMSPSHTIRRVKCHSHKMLCQCLSLFTKLLLDNKSTFFNLDHYEFFIVYETGMNKPMGFFSKDMLSIDNNNLGTILVLPPFQRKGLGTLLIEFSTALSNYHGLVSGPEKPLSPFGAALYLKYWSRNIYFELIKYTETSTFTIKDITEKTRFRCEDILLALEYMQCLQKVPQSDGTHAFCVVQHDLVKWGSENNIQKYRPVLAPEYLLLES